MTLYTCACESLRLISVAVITEIDVPLTCDGGREAPVIRGPATMCSGYWSRTQVISQVS